MVSITVIFNSLSHSDPTCGLLEVGSTDCFASLGVFFSWLLSAL